MNNRKTNFEMQITQDMVGLNIHVKNCARTQEFNEYNVNIKIKGISDEGLDLFGLTDEDCEA
jgi:hypothetical protein